MPRHRLAARYIPRHSGLAAHLQPSELPPAARLTTCHAHAGAASGSQRRSGIFKPAGACGSLGTASPRATSPDTAAWPPAFIPASYRPPPALLVPQLDADVPKARRL